MELAEHKQLYQDLIRAKAKRIKAHTEMFAGPRHPNQMGVLSTLEYERTSEKEREIGSALQTLGNSTRDQLFKMLQAQEQGERIDKKEAERLSNLATEIFADLAAI